MPTFEEVFDENKMKQYLFLLKITVLALLISSTSFCQEKFEQESRIMPADLPEFALNFSAIFEDSQRMKWYLEESLDGKSVEAKYKRNGQRFSVEFDTIGNLEDVEIIIREKDIPSTVFEKIRLKLQEDCESFRIDKTQIQFTGEAQKLKDVSVSGTCANCVVHYELVVRMKKDKEVVSFEYLFNDDGTLEKRSEIIIQTSSNLEY